MAQYFVLHPANPQPRLIRQAAEILRDGGVIAYPTDSSYALGCALGNYEAVRRIRDLRGVDEHHHLTLVLRDLVELGHFARLDNWQFRLVRQGVPGPFTFILPATREVPKRLIHPKRSTVGVRVPEHPVVHALLTELEAPILSSTLLLPGDEAPLNDPEVIRERLEKRLDVDPRRRRLPGGADLGDRPRGGSAGRGAPRARRSGADGARRRLTIPRRGSRVQ